MDSHVHADVSNASMAELSPKDKVILMRHMEMHRKHEGHESMHAEMIIVMFVTLIAAQILLVQWKKRHFTSYLFVTLFAMWIIPFGVSLKNFWWRFIFVWLVFSCITGLVFRKALQKPIHCTTPRLVYKWFYFLYKLSYVLGIISYVIYMATIFGLNLVFDVQPGVWMDCATLLLCYGFYFGVLGRDMAVICADTMASQIGYYAADNLPTRNLEPNVCAVCANRLLVSEHEQGVLENTYKLSCGHVFHEFCIRGWCIVGKKETCPYCKEKVDLKKIFRNVWERPHVLYGEVLDLIRFMVAWQPLIMLLVQGINFLLGLE